LQRFDCFWIWRMRQPHAYANDHDCGGCFPEPTLLEPSVVFQVNRDAGCPPGVTSNGREKTRRLGPFPNRSPGVAHASGRIDRYRPDSLRSISDGRASAGKHRRASARRHRTLKFCLIGLALLLQVRNRQWQIWCSLFWGAVAQFERDLIKERQREGIRAGQTTRRIHRP
jgi:hypothetical protein